MGLDRGKLARLFEALQTGVGLATNDRGLLALAAGTRDRRSREEDLRRQRFMTLQDQEREERRTLEAEERSQRRSDAVRQEGFEREDAKLRRAMLTERAEDFAGRGLDIPDEMLEGLAEFSGQELSDIEASFMAGRDLSPTEEVEQGLAAARSPAGLEAAKHRLETIEDEARIRQRFTTRQPRMTSEEQEQAAFDRSMGRLRAERKIGPKAKGATSRSIQETIEQVSSLTGSLRLALAPNKVTPEGITIDRAASLKFAKAKNQLESDIAVLEEEAQEMASAAQLGQVRGRMMAIQGRIDALRGTGR